MLKRCARGWIAVLACAIAVPATARNTGAATGATTERLSQLEAQRTAYAAMPDTPGTGPYAARVEMDPLLPNHTLYRPGDLGSLGRKKLGLLSWGNGGCSNDGASARLHLAEIASHGYLVIASGKILSGPAAGSAPAAMQFMTTTSDNMKQGLEWALAENGRKGSPYYHRIDPEAVAVSGHSCGGMLAIQLAADPRVKAIILHNSGIFPNRPERPTLVVDQSLLKSLHTPVLYVLGGKSDVAWPVGTGDFAYIDHVPLMLVSIDVGHGGTFWQPNGGKAAQVAVDWLEWQLRKDTKAARTFTGSDCRLCVDPAWTVQRKGIH
jgi:hypothetical protein